MEDSPKEARRPLAEVDAYLKGELIGPLGESAMELLRLAVDSQWRSPGEYMTRLTPKDKSRLNTVIVAGLTSLAREGSN